MSLHLTGMQPHACDPAQSLTDMVDKMEAAVPVASTKLSWWDIYENFPAVDRTTGCKDCSRPTLAAARAFPKKLGGGQGHGTKARATSSHAFPESFKEM